MCNLFISVHLIEDLIEDFLNYPSDMHFTGKVKASLKGRLTG